MNAVTHIKVNDTLYPATVCTFAHDKDWNSRKSKAITLEMSCSDALALFVDDLNWSEVCQFDDVTEEYDNSDYSIAGSVADNRNGTVTVKMGKPTDAEILAVITGG